MQIPYIDKRWYFFFIPTGLEYFVDGFGVTDFSLIAMAGFLPMGLVISLLSALTTSGRLLTYAVESWPSGRSISTA